MCSMSAQPGRRTGRFLKGPAFLPRKKVFQTRKHRPELIYSLEEHATEGFSRGGKALVFQLWAPSRGRVHRAGRGRTAYWVWGPWPPPATSKLGQAWGLAGPDPATHSDPTGSRQLPPGGGQEASLRGTALTHHAHGDEDRNLMDRVHHRLHRGENEHPVRRTSPAPSTPTRAWTRPVVGPHTGPPGLARTTVEVLRREVWVFEQTFTRSWPGSLST